MWQGRAIYTPPLTAELSGMTSLDEGWYAASVQFMDGAKIFHKVYVKIGCKSHFTCHHNLIRQPLISNLSRQFVLKSSSEQYNYFDLIYTPEKLIFLKILLFLRIELQLNLSPFDKNNEATIDSQVQRGASHAEFVLVEA